MKTLIAVPCMDTVHSLFAFSLAQLKVVEDSSLIMKTGSLVYESRNAIGLQAIESNADFVFWLDSDMVFKPDTLIRMMDTLRKNDLDMLTGVYFRRVPPYSPVLFDKLVLNGEEADYTEFKTIPEGLFEVGGCGFGCVLMKADVLYDVQSKFGNMFAPIGSNGEDVAFCWRARECGNKIMCDPSVICGHVGYSVIDEQFFKVFNVHRREV